MVALFSSRPRFIQKNFVRQVLWPSVIKLDPQYLKPAYRSHEIHEWPNDDVTYEVLEVEDEAGDL